MEVFKVLNPSDPQWDLTVSASSDSDVYQSAGYHALAEHLGEGSSRLFVVSEGAKFIALPLLIRPIPEIPGEVTGRWQDATSVYGYPGPMTSPQEPGPALVRAFHQGLEKWMRDNQVVSVFSRLHPLFDQGPMLAGLGEVVYVGDTVSIPLIGPDEEQWAAYRSNHRRDVRRLTQRGAVCSHDAAWRRLDRFVEIYQQTMERVGAEESYRFGRPYFEALRRFLGERARLFSVERDGHMMAGGVFLQHRGIIQYHLGGTDAAFLTEAPVKLLFDGVRRWSAGLGHRVFHLGGGVGGRSDSLFRFKAGFCDSRHRFCVWRWVVMPKQYAQLTEARRASEFAVAGDKDGGHFPAYRD